MRSKSEKVYTLAQVAKMLRKGTTTVYNYANGGLITLVPGKVSASGRPIKAVSAAEFERLKRDGVDPSGLRDELAKRGFSVKPTKKQVKRGASKTAAKSAAKKSVKRKAAAASGKIAKKRGKR
jgi:ParB-like chromosome segregation protein Spo0J